MPDISAPSADPRVFLLDPGPEPGGECVLVLCGGQTILIDGGHASGFNGHPGTDSIPEQIEAVLGTPPPFDISLLVVTHCHADHVGCLPEMVRDGMLRTEWTLAPDIESAWGSLTDGLPADAAALLPRYRALIDELRSSGSRVVRHGRDRAARLLEWMSPAGLEILGPSPAQIAACRSALRTSWTGPAKDSAEDAARAGAALNCQSIILAAGKPPHRVLLTGDMQFADPGVPALAKTMALLRRRVAKAGPFRAVKLPHHGSANGWSPEIHDEWGAPDLVAISTGHRAADHPAETVLRRLSGLRPSVQWARTDTNGLIEIRPSSRRSPLRVSKGRIDDDSPPKGRGVTVVSRDAGGSGGVEITARVPEHLRRVVITIESEPREAAPGERAAIHFAAGRQLPPLLFASSLERLAANVGRSVAEEAARAVRAAGHTLVDISDPARAMEAVRSRLRDGMAGVVLLGGYDILPSQRLDTLPPDIRGSIEDPSRDADRFIVWSDAGYGDADGSGMPEFPVSRIPDGRSAQLLAAALSSGAAEPGSRFVFRNSKRPFADDIASSIPGPEPALLSLPSTSSSVAPELARGALTYLMLHGLDSDCARFFGEEPAYPEAWRADQTPGGVGAAFCGCCWGALTTRQTAVECRPGKTPDPLRPHESVALSFLMNGANAFAGSTGSHYSPEDGEDGACAPLHRAFWKFLLAGSAPAEALFHAKLEYVAGMPHSAESPEELAVEYKILHEFTCLGLGW